ncbi:MAG: nucleoside triphosphate pyrophosphohydrolase [Xanthomonadaceae bacterium]|nr:nucleoside triphosphate pyrophosphohydrolase [Xanthomonadaceae bacterium]
MTENPSDPSPVASRNGIDRLLRIMARLRDRDHGCPWDIEQDFATIAPYTVEEAYEVADAIDRDDLPGLKDELGDLLLQVVFHAQMARERGAFDFGDVVQAICDKMVRRHPHVFGEARTGDAQAQARQWEAVKRAERAAAGEQDDSALAGIARGLPEWQRALKLQSRAARTGFEWTDPRPLIAKLHEEVEEVRAELAEQAGGRDGNDEAGKRRLREEIGDVLFVCANLARHAKVDVGTALRHANLKFERRFRMMESLAKADGTDFASLSLSQQEAYWRRAKQAERRAG